MATPATGALIQGWTVPYEGIERCELIRGPTDRPQLLLTLPSAEKAHELVMKCQLNEAHKEYFQYGFASKPEFPKQLILWGPDDVNHAKLLEVLKKSLGLN